MSIKHKFTSGLFWAVAGSGANNIISFIIFALLARVVSAETLGIVAFAVVFLELGRKVVHGGFPLLMVQRPEWDDLAASTCFWANLGVAAILTIIVALVIGPIMSVVFHPDVFIVLAVLSLNYILDGARIMHEAWLRRNFKFHSLALRGTSANLISGVVGVGLAVSGFGLWALIIHRLLSAFLMTVFTWALSSWRPEFKWSSAEYRAMVFDGMRLVMAEFLETFEKFSADLVLGLVLGPVAVAIYRVGNRGFEALLQIAITPLRTVALSAFSRVEDPETGIGRAYLKASKFSAIFACPVFLGSAVISGEFVRLVFGPGWNESALVMMALALAVFPSVVEYLLTTAMTAAGQSRSVMRQHMVVTSGTVIAALAAASFGPVAVAVAIAVRAHITLIYDFILLKRVLKVSPREVFAAIFPAFAAAAAMAIIVFAVGYYFLGDFGPIVSLIIKMAVGGVTYPLLLLIFSRAYLFSALTEVVSMLPASLRSRVPFLSGAKTTEGGPA